MRFTGLDVRDTLLLRRRWLRVNRRRGGRGLLPRVRRLWNDTTNDALAYPTTVENKNRRGSGNKSKKSVARTNTRVQGLAEYFILRRKRASIVRETIFARFLSDYITCHRALYVLVF